MEILNTSKDLGRFFGRLPAAPQRALLLDYDGTLAPFVIDRRRALPYPGVRETLARIAAARRPTHLAIVSGRPIDDLSLLVGVDRVELWGSHGLERMTVEGSRTREPPPRAGTSLIADIVPWATDRSWGGLLEKKPYGLAIHSRGVPAETFERARQAILGRWADIARGLGMEVMEFDGGFELRPAGAHKGHVVETVASELQDGSSVAYLGDDGTDEDAFRALRDGGLSVLVRFEKRPTAADAWIRPPEELLQFLAMWREAVEG
ncbi:MAG TPA: trehalose-phosphatase [Thermoanaerobaculia bacterium]|jgi:trehalose-phosphatase